MKIASLECNASRKHRRSRRHFAPLQSGHSLFEILPIAPDRAGYLHWCKTWAAEIARLLKADGSFFLNVGASPANPMFPHQIVLELRDLFVLQNTIHWIKSISIEEKMAEPSRMRPFQARSARKRYLNDCHESYFSLHQERVASKLIGSRIGVPYQDKTTFHAGRTHVGSDLRCRGNTWFIPYETISEPRKEASSSRRRFRCDWRNGVSSFTASRASKPCSIHFLGIWKFCRRSTEMRCKKIHRFRD